MERIVDDISIQIYDNNLLLLGIDHNLFIACSIYGLIDLWT